MNKKSWFVFVLVSLVVLIGLVLVSQKNKVEVGNVDPSNIQEASPQSGGIADHVFGNKDSKVILMEYGDYQCPGCGNVHPTLKATSEKYKDDIAFVYRNLPIPSLHANARAAAAAAEAAGKQDKFWEMHDKLFQNQSDWENVKPTDRLEFFNGYAKEIGIDTDTFKNDYAGQDINQKISFDEALFTKTGLTKATPTILLNGKQISQDVWGTQASLDQAIEDALKASGTN